MSNVLLYLALILIFTKFFGSICKHFKLPQVVGYVFAGLILGPTIWSAFTNWSPIMLANNPLAEDLFKGMAEIGVVFILFSAGLETDIKQMKSSGLEMFFVALFGVLLPMILGFLIAIPFIGGWGSLHETWDEALLIGTILTATSVGITVSTLKEMGKLKGKVGTIILSAAIIDDVIGILVLSTVIALNPINGSTGGNDTNIWLTLLKTLGFFVCAIIFGLVIRYFFIRLQKKYHRKRRLVAYAMGVCFLYAFCADKFFGVADITGAYIAGMILSTVKESTDIDERIETNTTIIFGPIFFAMIGLQTTFAGFKLEYLSFIVLFVIAGIVGKIVGCGLGAKLFKCTTRESIQIGIGMIARGEVAMVVVKKGMDAGIFVAENMINPSILVISLVFVTSFLCPLLLRISFKNENKESLQVQSTALLTDSIPQQSVDQ